jgi:hypothetical protein
MIYAPGNTEIFYSGHNIFLLERLHDRREFQQAALDCHSADFPEVLGGGARRPGLDADFLHRPDRQRSQNGGREIRYCY